MPVVHKSTIRRARQSEKRRLRNRSTISTNSGFVDNRHTDSPTFKA